LLLAPQLVTGAAQTRHYAKPGASVNNDCHDWANACALQTALTWPTGWTGGVIWAAAGVYTPTTNTSNRDATFEISVSNHNDGVVIYGGFVGTEANLGDRNPRLHPTVLSGDIGHDDGNTYHDYRDINGDNSYHVVKVDYGLSATLDGLTITAGKADRGNNNGSDQNQGGGLYSAGTVTLNDVTIRGNWARYGGGMELAFPFYGTLTNVTFRGNKGNNDGGAMHNCAGSIPVITNSTFAYNVANGNGGAIANGNSVSCGTLDQGNDPGSIGNGSTFQNVTVSQNSADHGDGVSNLGSNPQFIDSIFWDDAGTEFYNSGSYPTIVDSIVEGGCPADSLGPCVNVIDSDPFLGSLTNNGGNTDTMAIGGAGAATDAGGVNTTCPPPNTDQRGVTRPQGAACDIGAVEGEFLSISGTVFGIANPADRPNVTLSYNDGGARTAHPDTTGAYSIAIPSGWSGTVTPSLSGYTFVPLSRDYTNVTTSQTNEDYTAVFLYAVSGHVTGLSSSEVVNVDLDYSIDSGSTVTIHPDSTGYYSIWVPDGSDILITPSLAGYSFTPASRHPTVTSDLPNRDFAATSLTKTISGTVSGPAGLDLTSVDLNYNDGGAKTVHPDAGGVYTITIPTGWIGIVTPARIGYSFSPGNRYYTAVTSNVTGEDYLALEAPFAISGNAGTGGATLNYDVNGPQTAIADGGGNYMFFVPPDWSGTVTPTKLGYSFNPGSRNYTNVYSNYAGQNYTASLVLSPKTDFDGDLTTDPAKYVPSTGALFDLQSSTGTWSGAFLGTDGTYVRNSDFDGDGITDPAKYVASAGALWYLGSVDSTWHGVYIGSDGTYIPGSDFDGDGKADPAKFVAASGSLWYLASATNTWHGVYVGSSGTYVTGSDFDGDGKTDPARYDAGAIYYLQSSTDTWQSVYIGSDGSYVPRSDFDGDGKTDPAKFVGGYIWYLQSSDNTWHNFNLGTDGTVVPGSDFDGDGKTDPAKYVASSGAIWYMRSGFGYSWTGFYMGSDTYDIVN